jgi:GntR family transcriptional regulator, transcriptional repressor for pyruvate dehydrogenase complex
MTTVERPRLIDQVLASLLNLIQTSGVSPGDALPRERELAAQLDVSRSMIRQAFRVLEDRGIVDSRQGSGRYLRVASSQDPDLPHALETASIVDILEARIILERNCVALACERRTAGEAATINQRASTLTSFRDNMAFHVAIASATHNFMLERLVRQQIELADQLDQRGRYDDADAVDAMKDRGVDAHRADPGRALVGALVEHAAIAEAITNRDAAAARELMVVHLQQTSKAVLAAQRKTRPAPTPVDDA